MMEKLAPFLELFFLGNPVLSWSLFLLIILLSFILRKFISSYIINLILNYIDNKQKNYADLQKAINNIIFITFLYLACGQLEYPKSWNLGPSNEFGLKMLVYKGYLLILYFYVIKFFLNLTEYFGNNFKEKASKTSSKLDDQLIPFAIDSIKVIVVILGLFMIIGNVFNVNITALAAGLGVGGIAIAMASKESLENLFGSFTIFLDRPFTVGDIVNIGSITGIVEKVGFRSTRIRTFDRSLVTVPNKKMIDAELDNLGLRPVRRAKFNIGLTYETSSEKIKTIVKEIQNLIDQHPKTNDDGRVRFMEFGDSSLDIMVIYYVNSPEWDDFIDTRENINYGIMSIIENNGSSFAFPSSSIYIEKNNA
ncbi:MAG: mechanosensitive ion channel protein MscS [Flavobacteriales bacterium]|nr:mechanosensitive ion channel protein MscS [Flavobacteriales bacterium]